MPPTDLSSQVKFFLSLILTLTMVGCGRPREGCDPKPAELTNISNLEDANPTVIPTPLSPEFVQSLWEAGPHANTYVQAEDNTNSACARCHAPLLWVPTEDEIPLIWTENSVEPASGYTYISELDWSHIPCLVCHEMIENEVSAGYAWLEIPQLEMYSLLENTTFLCQKCHLGSEFPGHYPLTIQETHQDFNCTDCHNAHETKATCTSSTCHEPFAQECESIDTHDKPHSEVTCSACHDAGEPEIQWNEELLAWDTYRPETEGYEPYVSHNILLEVDCDRCHSPGDHPWDP